LTQKHFAAVVPGFMAKLLRDFPELDVLDAAAIFGNAGHESKGLTDDQEDKPVVPGSKGGLNWMQWTGPRRRAFEAYCKRNGIDPNSDKAAYKYLFIELKGIEGTEKGAIKAVLSAGSLEEKVKAFEKAYLRAGVKHYPSRLAWANRALEAWNTSAKMLEPDPIDLGGIAQPDIPAPKPAPVPPAQSVEKKTGFGAGAVVAVLVILAIAFAVWFIGFRR